MPVRRALEFSSQETPTGLKVNIDKQPDVIPTTILTSRDFYWWACQTYMQRVKTFIKFILVCDKIIFRGISLDRRHDCWTRTSREPEKGLDCGLGETYCAGI